MNEKTIELPPTRENQKAGRRILVFLVIFFAAPILLVVLMHRFGWQPSGSTHGELVSPLRALRVPGSLLDMHGKEIQPGFLRDKWSMVYISGECGTPCRARLHDMRQLHVSLAKDIDRVQRLFVTSATSVSEVHEAYPDMIIINQPTDKLAEFGRQFAVSGMPVEKANRIYLVDPLGNLMMSFPESLSAREVRNDIARLLRYSWAG